MQTTDLRIPRRALVTCAALALIAIGACGGDSTSPNTTEFGHYTLVSVNGQNLPFTLTGTIRGTVVVQSGSVDLAAGTATSGNKPTYLAGVAGTAGTSGTSQLLTDNGTYVLTGTAITFSSALLAGAQYGGALADNAITLTLPGALLGTTGNIVLKLQR
jgi:hypothetical protein